MIKELLEHRIELAKLIASEGKGQAVYQGNGDYKRIPSALEEKMSDLDKLIEKAIEGQGVSATLSAAIEKHPELMEDPDGDIVKVEIKQEGGYYSDGSDYVMEEKENPWIKNPGYRPVDGDVLVEIRSDTNSYVNERGVIHAGNWNWSLGSNADIHYYRLAEKEDK